jgi:hypothetical protein
VYAGFLNTNNDMPAEQAERHGRYCAAGCTLGLRQGRFMTADPSRLRPLPLDDREAFARWAQLDVGRSSQVHRRSAHARHEAGEAHPEPGPLNSMHGSLGQGRCPPCP